LTQGVSTSPSSLLTRVLSTGNRPSLDLSDQVVVDSLARISDFGGFGDVYKGKYTSPQTGKSTCVALKRLRIQIGASDEELVKFHKGLAKEIRIWSEFYAIARIRDGGGIPVSCI